MKKYLIPALIACFILLTSCGTSTNNVAPQFNPRTGSQGIDFNFIKDAPPQEIYDGTKAPFAVTLENKGASDVLEGYITWNIPPDIFQIDHAIDSFDLYGKTVNNPQGEQKTLYQYATAKSLPTMQEVQTITIGATLCYAYETQFSMEVCIDPEIPRKTTKNKACTIQDISSSGQGAPLVINKVEVSIAPLDNDQVKPRFKIFIRNQGQGTVINKDEVQTECTSSSGATVYNVIYIEEAKLSKIYNLECSGLRKDSSTGRSYILLDPKAETSFICEVGGGISKDKGAYLSPLTLTLGYGYTETKSQQVEIRSRKV